MIAHIYKGTDGTYREQSIVEHLQGTALFAKKAGSRIGMGCLAYLTAILHDIGKWRLLFADYIRQSYRNDKRTVKQKINHSSAGAVYVYRKYYKGSRTERLTAQLIAVAILSHHGLNDCMSPDGTDKFHQRVENIEGLDYEEVINNLNNSSISEMELDHYFTDAVKEVEALLKCLQRYQSSLYFSQAMMERMLLSLLIDADRLDTAIFCGNRAKTDIEEKEVPWKELCDGFEINMEEKLTHFDQNSEIYRIRKKVEDDCLRAAVYKTGIYRITVPTGGAKTIGGIRFLLHHARVRKKRRIFYIAPYLSILEQNAEEFRNMIGHQSMILEHHSNVILQESEKDEQIALEKYQHLTENWDAPIVLTTFVKFLETLFDGSTGAVRRFHNLSDAVIFIDEIQTLPIQMLHMFNMAANFLSEVWNTTIILSSATQPILSEVDNPIHLGRPLNLVDDVEELYHSLIRVRIEEKKEMLGTDELCGFVYQIMRSKKSVLVILNTKKAVRTLYKALASYYDTEKEGILLIHLSTNMCAKHRMRNIVKLKEHLGKERVICVSTSLIEAGVDLSFASVVRSFTGLDSIAQSAGRCNRNREEKEGIVYLIHYKEERLGNLDQIRKGASCSEAVVNSFDKFPEQYGRNLLSPEALVAYYERYYYDQDQKRLMDYPLDSLGSNMVDLLSMNKVGRFAYFNRNERKMNPDLEMFQAFKTAGKEFEVIHNHAAGVIVPFEKGAELIEKINALPSEEELPELLKEVQQYTVDIDSSRLDTKMVYELRCRGVLAVKKEYYDDCLGIKYQD